MDKKFGMQRIQRKQVRQDKVDSLKSILKNSQEESTLLELITPSYIAQHEFGIEVSAFDVVYAMLGLLESTVSNTYIQFNFLLI